MRPCPRGRRGTAWERRVRPVPGRARSGESGRIERRAYRASDDLTGSGSLALRRIQRLIRTFRLGFAVCPLASLTVTPTRVVIVFSLRCFIPLRDLALSLIVNVF